jgi:hypothetical protein
MNQKPNMSVSNYAAAKKHLCPKCAEPLKALTVGNVINSGPSGKSSKFPTNGNYMYGNVKSYKTEYQCTSCRMRYTLDDLKKIEESYKKSK